MKNILKSRYISFLLALLMVVGVFLPHGGALAKDNDKYTIEIGVTINEKDKLKEKLKDGGILKSSGRQVKVYKLKVDGEMTDSDRLELANTYNSKSIADTEKKLKEKIEKVIISEKSKLSYSDKLYDEIDTGSFKDFSVDSLSEKIEISDLDAGYYLIKETDESKKIEDKQFVTQVVKLPGDKMNGNILNINAKETQDVPKDNLKLIKVDSNNKDYRLNHAQFELYKKMEDGKDQRVKVSGSRGNYLYDENGNTTVLETWENGEINVQKVPKGTYYFKEIKPAPGYGEEGNKGTLSKDLKPGDTTQIENKSTPILKKIDKNDRNKTLDGAVFEIYKKDGTKLNFKKTNAGYEVDPNGKDELVTKDKGILNITNLKDGEYTIKEVKAPKDYILSDEEKEFTIKKFNSVDKDGKLKILTFTNEPDSDTPPTTPTGGYNFVKIDSTNDKKRLGGAKFILMKKVGDSYEKVLVEGKEVKLTSKDNGEFSIAGLEYGEYALKEIEAPKNHFITKELTPFTIDAASSSLPAEEIVNEPYVPSVVTSRSNTITTKYTPSDVTRIVKSPLVKTGDIRIVIMAVVGFILLLMGIKLVNSGERIQRV